MAAYIRAGAHGMLPTAGQLNPLQMAHLGTSAAILQLSVSELHASRVGKIPALGKILDRVRVGQVSVVEELLNVVTLTEVIKEVMSDADKAAERTAAASKDGAKSATGGPQGEGPDDEDPKKRKYKEAPYHHQQSAGLKSKAPSDGQKALDNSVPYGERGNRIAVDKTSEEIVVLMKDGPGNYHGHVRSWDGLEPAMQKALTDNGLVRVMGSGQKVKL